jgi:hypothetical protein
MLIRSITITFRFGGFGILCNSTHLPFSLFISSTDCCKVVDSDDIPGLVAGFHDYAVSVHPSVSSGIANCLQHQYTKGLTVCQAGNFKEFAGPAAAMIVKSPPRKGRACSGVM